MPRPIRSPPLPARQTGVLLSPHAKRVQAVLATDRRFKILEQVADKQTIHIGELAREFGVSEMTVRRDIRRLERDGFLRRTYGGATAHLTRSLDLAFNARALEHAREKRLIGMMAARFLGDVHAVFLGIGTTCEQVARYLPAEADLTVVTGSLPSASLLGTRPLRVVALGGTVVRDELSCVGPEATATLRRHRFDLAIVGAAGVSARAGLTDFTDEDAEISRLGIEQAARVIVVADGSKLGAITMAVVVPANRIDILVTDDAAADDEIKALRGLGIQVVIASARNGSTVDDPSIVQLHAASSS